MAAPGQDLRFAFRQLWKAPGFTLTVVLTLAIGIGATTAIFSLVEGILLSPLPFSDPDRLVLLGDHLGAGGNTPVTAREIVTYSTATSAFSSLGGYATGQHELSGVAIPEEISAARLTASVFPTLGVQPVLGRVFTPEEEDAHRQLAVISHTLWVNRYDRDPQVLGRSIDLDSKSYTIIGVMPDDFEFPLLAGGHISQTQLWIPMSLTPEELSDGRAGMWGFRMVGRLKDGVTVQQAAQDVDRVARQIMQSFPPSMSSIHIRGDAILLREDAVANARPLLRTLFAAVMVVLLIACANVAGLLLVRAIRRRREYAVRLAIGARPIVILRQSLLEGLLLSAAGGLLGLALAAVLVRTALHLLPGSMPRVDSISINATVAAFALLVSVATGALCSVAPAFAAMRTNLIENLKESPQAGTGGASHGRLRSALVVAEIAIALVLLTTSVALLRSFQKMRAVDPGFRPDHVLVADYQLPRQRYATRDAAESFDRAVVDRLKVKPGIAAVGITQSLPATGFSGMAAYTIEGESVEKWKLTFAQFDTTYGDYFHAMGIPLLDGRYFTMDDGPNSPLVVIVNQSMARHSWPGQRAVGKRMHAGNPHKDMPWATVVGVVADTKLGSRDEPSGDQWYSPMQQPATLYGTRWAGELTDAAGGFITLRSALPPEQMRETLRSTVAEVDPLLALQHVQTMNDVISKSEAPRRFNTDLIALFSLMALLLAIIGIYGVVAFSVSQRTQEIAIRMAVGAPRGSIAGLVLTWGARLALIGCIVGVLGSLAASRLVSSFLFEVSATDPLIYITSFLIMMLMALAASALPATRAASADPVKALRSN
jgi:predicted permease